MEIDSNNILCPYCQSICGGYDDFEGDGFDDESKEFECDTCGKKIKENIYYELKNGKFTECK